MKVQFCQIVRVDTVYNDLQVSMKGILEEKQQQSGTRQHLLNCPEKSWCFKLERDVPFLVCVHFSGYFLHNGRAKK